MSWYWLLEIKQYKKFPLICKFDDCDKLFLTWKGIAQWVTVTIWCAFILGPSISKPAVKSASWMDTAKQRMMMLTQRVDGHGINIEQE